MVAIRSMMRWYLFSIVSPLASVFKRRRTFARQHNKNGWLTVGGETLW